MRIVLILLCFLLLGARSLPGLDLSFASGARFPPSFEDNAFAYGFALFSLTVISATSAALLLQFLFDRRAKTRLSLELGETAYLGSCAPGSACGLYRFQISTLMWTMLLGALPDVLVLLAWGEASDPLMWLLFQTDRVGDGLAGIPFTMFALSYLLSGKVIEHRLSLDVEDVPLHPRWVQLKEKVRIVVLALVIALGVTAYKAGLV